MAQIKVAAICITKGEASSMFLVGVCGVSNVRGGGKGPLLAKTEANTQRYGVDTVILKVDPSMLSVYRGCCLSAGLHYS